MRVGDALLDCERDDVLDLEAVEERLGVGTEETDWVIDGVRVASVLVVRVGVTDGELVRLDDDEDEGDADCDIDGSWLRVAVDEGVSVWLLLDDSLPVPEADGVAAPLGVGELLRVDDRL